MSLIEIPVLTTAQKQAAVERRINLQCVSTFNLMVNAHVMIVSDILHNPDGLTPQEVMAAIGRQGEQLLMLSETLKGVVNSIKPGAIADLPANITFVPNGDKSVSIVIS